MELEELAKRKYKTFDTFTYFDDLLVSGSSVEIQKRKEKMKVLDCDYYM